MALGHRSHMSQTGHRNTLADTLAPASQVRFLSHLAKKCLRVRRALHASLSLGLRRTATEKRQEFVLPGRLPGGSRPGRTGSNLDPVS